MPSSPWFNDDQWESMQEQETSRPVEGQTNERRQVSRLLSEITVLMNTADALGLLIVGDALRDATTHTLNALLATPPAPESEDTDG